VVVGQLGDPVMVETSLGDPVACLEQSEHPVTIEMSFGDPVIGNNLLIGYLKKFPSLATLGIIISIITLYYILLY
jgi:hypothetical protein